MALDFASIASKPVSDIERPPLPPVGHYIWAISKLPAVRENVGDGKYDIVEFNLRCVQPTDDVDLEDYKGDPKKIMQRLAFMFDKEDEVAFQQTEFRFKQFLLNHCRVGDEQMSLSQLMNASVGAQFMANIVWKQDKNDPELMHANLGRTAPVE